MDSIKKEAAQVLLSAMKKAEEAMDKLMEGQEENRLGRYGMDYARQLNLLARGLGSLIGEVRENGVEECGD